jgi:hypothetical protein
MVDTNILAKKVREISYYSEKFNKKIEIDRIKINTDENGCIVRLPDDTIVFNADYDGKPSVFRQGYWINYIENVHRIIELERQSKAIENFTPINDLHFFS